MRVITKNQILTVLLAICLIIVGYVNYSKKSKEIGDNTVSDIRNYTEGMGDAKLVSSDNVEETEMNNSVENQEIIETTNMDYEIEEKYFDESKIERNKRYSQTIEIYEKMLESSNITNEQKYIAQNEIQKLTKTQNTILLVEDLLKIKGFEDLIIYENNGNVSVIIKSEQIEQQEIAQIQNIVSREFNIGTENINITNKV